MVSSSFISVNILTSLLMIHGYFSTADRNEVSKGAVNEDFADRSNNIVKSCTPRHVHLSFGDEITYMKVLWATAEKCENCEVLYGLGPSSLNNRAPSNYSKLVKYNKKGLQHLHLSDLKDLHPDTTYFYSPMCGGNQSGPFSFHVPQIHSNWAAEYLVYGDMGVETKSVETVIQEAQSGRYTAVFHIGDFAYDFHNKGGMVGDKFMDMIESAASRLPYMTCPGNHEIDWDTFSHYRHRFSMPDSEWPIPFDKMWYSFDIGPVHFISYSTEVFFTNGGKYVQAQKEWLLDDLGLANSRRNVTPWVIAFGHRPLYCSTRINDDCSLASSFVRQGLEQIFYEQKVDLLLQAHEHNYERLWPVYQDIITDYGYTNVRSPIQIITGAAGNHLGTDHFVRDDIPAWTAFRVGEPALNSYGRMLVQNRTHIFWEQRSALDHTLIDQIWITKDDSFERNSSIPFVKKTHEKESHMFAFSIVVICLSVFLVVIIIRFVVQKWRKQKFNKTWHRPLDQDEDLEEDEVFNQSSYATSLM